MVHVIVHGHAVSPEEGFVKQVGLELSIRTQSSIYYKSLAFPTNCIKYWKKQNRSANHKDNY